MAKAGEHDVRIGTAGWNYPTPGYGPWTGVFYPLKQGQKIPGTNAKFDELADADKLGALLCQFPASFKREDARGRCHRLVPDRRCGGQ